jgi:hypothetical protein
MCQGLPLSGSHLPQIVVTSLAAALPAMRHSPSPGRSSRDLSPGPPGFVMGQRPPLALEHAGSLASEMPAIRRSRGMRGVKATPSVFAGIRDALLALGGLGGVSGLSDQKAPLREYRRRGKMMGLTCPKSIIFPRSSSMERATFFPKRPAIS